MPLIAMTREMGSLGRDVASAIAERQGRPVVYHEIIAPVANKMRLRKSHVERFLEGRSGLWERLTTDRTSLSIFTADETFRLLREGGASVIRGWGAVHLLKDVPHVVRVRIVAPVELRIRRMMERLGTDNRQAVAAEIELAEEAHTAITRRHFGVNWRDPEHYDAVLSTERLSVEECVEEIEGLMARPAFRETPESLRTVEDLALAWSVRSALRRDERTADLAVDVRSDGGRVTLAGLAHDGREAGAAEEVARGVAGVASVDNRLKPAAGSLRFRREA